MMNPHTVLLLGDQRFAVQWQWLDATAVPGISTVAVTNENEIVVACRQAPHIRIFDSQGGLLRSFSIEGMICPHHISIDQQQRLWVTDLDGHQIFGVDLEGSLLQHLGAADEPRWQAPFNHPTHAIFADDTLWVSDGYGNARSEERRVGKEGRPRRWAKTEDKDGLIASGRSDSTEPRGKPST